MHFILISDYFEHSSTESMACTNKCIESSINNNNCKAKYTCVNTMNIIRIACLFVVVQFIVCAVGGNKFEHKVIELINGTISLFLQNRNIIKLIDNKLAVLYTTDSFVNKYNNIIILFINKLFNSLVECIKCKYSSPLHAETI